MRKIPQLMHSSTKIIWNIFDAISMSKNIGQLTDLKKFVIISTPRTGSNLLCGMLGSHSQITCFHELYHPDAIYYGPTTRDKFNLGTILERDRQPFKFLSKIYNKENQSQAIGFKIFPNHNQKILNFVLSRPDIKKIILKRENLLFGYISALTARQTKQWQNAIGTDTNNQVKETVKVNVDTNEFIAFIKKNNDFFDYVESKIIGQESICINYRDMISDDNISKDLLEFLGINADPDIKLTKLHTKQNTHKLSNRISNYEEFKAQLSHTPYKTFLNE